MTLKCYFLHFCRGLILILFIAFSAASGEDKPNPPVPSDKISTEKPTPEEKAPDKDKKPVLSPPKAGEGTEGDAKAPSKPDKGGPPRDFLKLAEPKPLNEKKQAPKNIPWGGYWSAVFRGSPDEEEPTLESRPPRPEPLKPEAKPHSLAEYKEVDFARFASGSYASEYGGKYVRLRCRFASLAPEGTRLSDFPPPEYINFLVVGLGSSMENLTVAARAELGDKIFRMESGKEITLYGLAHRLGLSGLTLVVEEIETVKK
jgi:hypothetical protein